MLPSYWRWAELEHGGTVDALLNSKGDDESIPVMRLEKASLSVAISVSTLPATAVSSNEPQKIELERDGVEGRISK